MNTDTTPSTVNGIDLAALRGATDAITADAPAGATQWRITSRWQGGARADHQVNGYGIGGCWVDRAFTLRTDEPLELCGTNRHPNPQEFLLSALNACMIVGYAAVAGLMGIQLESLEVELSGDIDLRGFLGLDDKVIPGYACLEQTVRIRSNASPEQLHRLHETVQARSPNFHNVTHAVPTRSRLMIG